MRILFVLVPILAAATAMARDVQSFQPGSEAVPAAMMGSHEAAHADHEGYFESWMFMLYRKDRGWMQARFVLTNIGPRDNHGAVDLMRYVPRKVEPERDEPFARLIRKVRPSKRKTANAPLSLEFAKNSLKKVKGGFRLELDIKDYRFEADIKTVGVTWRPGNGVAKFPNGQSFSVHLMPSLARFTGREKWGDGEWKPVSGTAWGEHGLTDVMAHRLSDRFLRFHGRKGRYAVAYHELFTPEDLGSERLGWLVVTKGPKVVASSLVARSKPTKFRRDKRRPHHNVPREYDVRARHDSGVIEMSVKTGRRIFREDVLQTVPGWVRTVIEIFIQPVNYFHRATFEIALPSGTTIQGRGVSMYSPMKAKR